MTIFVDFKSCYIIFIFKQEETDTEDDALDEDDFEAPANFKIMTVNVTSTRSDTIVGNSLKIARKLV